MSDEAELELSDNEEQDHKSELVARAQKEVDNMEPKKEDYSSSSDSPQPDTYNAISDNDNEPQADYGYNEEPAPEKPKKKRASKVVEDPAAKSLEDEFLALLPRKAKRAGKTEEDEFIKYNETRAKSILEEMDKAYDKEWQAKLAKSRISFLRHQFLTKTLEPQSYDKQLSEALISAGILDRFKTWLSPFPDGSIPSITIVEIILKCLSSYKLSDENIKNSGIVEVVNAIDTRNTSAKIKEIKENLISTWKRKLVQAKSGSEVQRSTTIDPDMDMANSMRNSNYFRSQDAAKRMRSVDERMKELEARGYNVQPEPNMMAKEPMRIFKSINKVRRTNK